MLLQQRNTIIRICATVANLYLNGELSICEKTDCENREPLKPPANTDALRRQIQELLGELSQAAVREEPAPFDSRRADVGIAQLDRLIREFQQLSTTYET